MTAGKPSSSPSSQFFLPSFILACEKLSPSEFIHLYVSINVRPVFFFLFNVSLGSLFHCTDSDVTRYNTAKQPIKRNTFVWILHQVSRAVIFLSHFVYFIMVSAVVTSRLSWLYFLLFECIHDIFLPCILGEIEILLHILSKRTHCSKEVPWFVGYHTHWQWGLLYNQE